MLSSFRSLTAIAVTALAVLAFASPAVAQDTTPPGGLQQLPAPNDCISTQTDADPAECGTTISGGVTDAEGVALSPDGKNLYVASSGGTNPGSLATFTRNLSTGELSFNACVRDPSSPENCASELSQLQGAASVVVSPNGAHVYVASADSDAVRGFSRNTTTGALTPLALPGGCVQAIGAGGCTNGDDGLNGVQFLVMDPAGETLYAISEASDKIVVLDRNTSTGALTNASSVTQNEVRAADISPDGLHLYAVSTSSTLVSYDRDNSSGALTMDQCFRGTLTLPSACPATPGLNNAHDVEVVSRPGGGWDVYTVGTGSASGPGSSITRFSDAAGDGTLASGECRRDNESNETCSGATFVGILDATSIASRPDGEFLYVTGRGDNAIAYIDRDTSNGTLTQGGGDQGCVSDFDSDCGADGAKTGLTGVIDVAVGSRFAYSVSPDDDAVAEFAIQYVPECSDITRNDVPFETAVTIPAQCVDQNQPRDLLTIEVTSQPGPDPDPPDEGTAEAVDTNNDGRADSLRYTPADNFIGTTSFTYRAVDDQGNPSANATVNITVQPSGTPVFSIADAAASEADGTITFTLTRAGPTGTAHTVTWSTQDDTATAGQDYTQQTGQTVTFNVGETQKTIAVPITNDNVDEINEKLRVNLTAVSGTASISDPLGVGTIGDDDTAVVSIGDATAPEDGPPASLTVTLSNPSSRTVTVQYDTATGTASQLDFAAAPEDATVSLAPGTTTANIVIGIFDDSTVEQDEQFSVVLSAPTGGAALGDASGEVTIVDDDVPTVSVSDASIAEGDSGTRNATFGVSLSAPTSKTVTVNFATSNGSASSGSDYNSTTGTLTFSPGQTTKTVDVAVAGDTTFEPDETFIVTLSAPTNATISDGTGSGTIQNDDPAPVEQPPPGEPNTTIVAGDTGLAEGDGGTRNAVFTVSLSRAATAPITVDVATADGTATGGSDYRSVAARLTFAVGETTKAVPVAVVGDTTPEADETFQLRLTNASGADIVKAVGTATIANDDIRRRLPGLTFTVSPRSDLTLPHVFRVRGRLILPTGLTAAEACGTGTVTAQYKNGGNTISTRRTTIDALCRFTIRTPFNVRSRLRNARRLKVVVRFTGNRFLSPRQGRSVFVRVRR